MESQNHFDGERSGDVWILRLNKEKLDASLMIDQLRNELQTFVNDKHATKLLIVCKGIVRMTSEVINAFLLIRRIVKSMGGDVKLCELDPDVRMSFKLLNLDGPVFKIYDTEENASIAF